MQGGTAGCQMLIALAMIIHVPHLLHLCQLVTIAMLGIVALMQLIDHAAFGYDMPSWPL